MNLEYIFTTQRIFEEMVLEIMIEKRWDWKKLFSLG